MDRRKSIKTMALGAMAPNFIVNDSTFNWVSEAADGELSVESRWDEWPDMDWVGPEYWGNRLQDWQLRDGRVVCVVSNDNRALHHLTTQLSPADGSFESSVVIRFLNDALIPASNCITGFRIGAKGKFDDYRSAAVFGKGIDVGVNPKGELRIDGRIAGSISRLPEEILLHIKIAPKGHGYKIDASIKDVQRDQQLLAVSRDGFSRLTMEGNIALLASVDDKKLRSESPLASFSDWKMRGTKLLHQPEQVYGPICFAQYTIHKNILKLTAQLAPVERIKSKKIELQVKIDGEWRTLSKSTIHPMARTAEFRVEKWQHENTIPYRVKIQLPLKYDQEEFYYHGSIAAEPREEEVRVALFSCNADYGFPDADVAPHVAFHRPHVALFVGDQFYERTGGFGVQRSPLEKASLDYLRKWMMFGWSYREIFRHIPCAFIPDDHDVYHGNLWGESGKEADTSQGFGASAQDSGGYKMPPKWVNMVQKTQTSHLPDPFDPTPVKQGIDVYYTQWNYGGISFAILEDRKFKSAPRQVLPDEAKVVNGWIQNPEFNIKNFRAENAELLGQRQLKFLDEWSKDWSDNVHMKALVSQTIFNAVSTLPEGSTSGSIIPSLKIPTPGEYIQGDAINADMDTNGWPQTGRDSAVRKIRRCFAFHLAGDQHLASFTQYGVDNYGDSGFAFAGPALNNLWPRRWWPPVVHTHSHTIKNPAYTGNYEDGFGNKMTVRAVANPHQTGHEPAIVHDRATGYGIVTFNKKNRTIHSQCWPRYENPAENPNGQFPGWPVTVAQEDNYGRKAEAWLPEIKVNGIINPVVQVINESSGEMLYTLRIQGNRYVPKVFAKGNYTIRVTDPDRGIVLEKKRIKASTKKKKNLLFTA